MKIEQIIVQQLYGNKKVTLQGIGTFSIDNEGTLPADSEKGISENPISFEYDPKAEKDDALIDVIVQQTKKIKPLASADLDSFLRLGKDFLNIGKPFTIEGLGTLDKAQTGELIFIPGQFITPKIEAPKALKENEAEEKSGLFPDYDSEIKSKSSKSILIIAVLVILGLGAWAAYYFFSDKDEAHVNETQALQIDKQDSVTGKNDTTITTVEKDNYTFKIVFKKTRDKKAALKVYNKMKSYGHTVIMYTNDSVTYKVAEPFTLPLSDTTHIKDSLNRYYYLGKGRVELK